MSCTMTTFIWRFKFVSSQISFVHSSLLLNVLRDFSLLILSTMISSEWYRAVNMFFREFCFALVSRAFFTISFDVIFCVIWIFSCSIIFIAIFNSLLEESVDVFVASTSDLITAISRRAIVAQVLFFFWYVFFFFAILFNRVVTSFNFLIVFVDLNTKWASFARVTRDVLINWSRTLTSRNDSSWGGFLSSKPTSHWVEFFVMWDEF